MAIGYCESCGNSQFKTVLHDQVHKYIENGKTAEWHYALNQCTSCRMGFISPKPTMAILQTFYGPDYGSYAVNEDFYLTKEADSLKYKISKLRYASTIEPSLRNNLVSVLGIIAEWFTGRVVSHTLGLPLNLPKNARILDIGYGSGSWLLIMRRLGYSKLHGYDIEANVENKTRLETVGISVHSGVLSKGGYLDNYFDCIRLNHSFEHLLEPTIILTELQRILKPGGALVMSFPSINCLSFSLSPTLSPIGELPRHLYLHTPKSACNIVTRAGFKIRDVRIYAVVLLLEGVINNIFKAKNIPITLRGFSYLAPIYHLINVIARRGEFITLLATK